MSKKIRLNLATKKKHVQDVWLVQNPALEVLYQWELQMMDTFIQIGIRAFV